MKKQMLALLAIAAMAGCSKSEVVNDETPAGSANTPISFKTFVGKATKATETTTANLTTFEMAAYTAVGTGAPENFITLGSVTKNGSDWEYSGPQYFPAGKSVSFFAYSPKTDAAKATVTYNEPQDGTWPSIGYTVPEPAKQVDLIATSVLAKTTGTINLSFQHLLSQIVFTVYGENLNYSYELTNVTLQKVLPTSTFTFTGIGDNAGAWATASGTAKDYIYFAGSMSFDGLETAQPVVGTDGPLMLMPQTNSAMPGSEIQISVTYKATEKNAPHNISFNGIKTAVLPSAQWEMGKKYTYALTLTPGELIKVDPKVGDFTPATENPEPVKP